MVVVGFHLAGGFLVDFFFPVVMSSSWLALPCLLGWGWLKKLLLPSKFGVAEAAGREAEQ